MENEEELDRDAWKILNKALKQIDFPEYVKVSKNEDESFSFAISLNYKSVGSAYIFFKPSNEVVKRLLTLTKKGDKRLNFSDALTENFNQSLAGLYAYLFLKSFNIEIEETLANLDEIPLLLPQLMMCSLFEDSPHLSESTKKARIEKTKGDLEDLLEARKQRTKKRIVEEIEIAEIPYRPVKNLIGYYYERLLPQWEEAKDCYKRNKKFSNWEKMVAVNFDDLPEDLINRLGDADTYNSMPSSIALEHSARICGIKNDSLGLRALQKHLQQSRSWIAKVGIEAVEKEAEEYFYKNFQEVVRSMQVANWVGKEKDFDSDSLFHKMIAKSWGDKINKIIEEGDSENINDELAEKPYVH